MSTPSSPPPGTHYDEGVLSSSTPGPRQSSSTYPITRTVAIIKTHALGHRFDIEPRIQEASFEVRSHSIWNVIYKEAHLLLDILNRL